MLHEKGVCVLPIHYFLPRDVTQLQTPHRCLIDIYWTKEWTKENSKEHWNWTENYETLEYLVGDVTLMLTNIYWVLTMLLAPSLPPYTSCYFVQQQKCKVRLTCNTSRQEHNLASSDAPFGRTLILIPKNCQGMLLVCIYITDKVRYWFMLVNQKPWT